MTGLENWTILMDVICVSSFKEVKRYIITDFRHTSTLTMRKSVRIRSFSGLYFPTFGKIFLHSL